MQTITARYVQRDEDWTVTVSGLGRTLNGEASGIIAARDQADQLVERLAPGGARPTVVHLLNGSAVDFTSTYMTARLTRPSEENSVAGADANAETGAKGETDGTCETGTKGATARAGAVNDRTPDTSADEEQTSATTARGATPQADEEAVPGAPNTGGPSVPRKELPRDPVAAPRRYAHAG